jgi:homoserine dehydrogenase
LLINSAGLPVINTLQDLLSTGDEIHRIEGIFSGTLSFLFNTFSTSTASFSSIVNDAKAQGFTEPDPRDDLNGVDVARKVVILARECGMEFEIDKLDVLVNIVPDTLRPLDTTEFMNRLPEFDTYFEEMKQAAEKNGNVLRYVGVVDVKNGKCMVELKEYDLSHPFAALKGSDNIIAFHTARFSPQPLIIQGPGMIIMLMILRSWVCGHCVWCVC